MCDIGGAFTAPLGELMPRKQLSVGSNILKSNTKTFIHRRVEDKATAESIFA